MKYLNSLRKVDTNDLPAKETSQSGFYIKKKYFF